jgi:hypothetical protein
MKQKTLASRERLVFFDHLRALMVLLVLLFHAGASYGSMVAFWPYHDPNPSELIDHIMPLLDVFMMSILFFIAGYFALPSLQKRGGRRFLAAKFRRLGIPWLVVTFFLLPVLDYIHTFTQSIAEGLWHALVAQRCALFPVAHRPDAHVGVPGHDRAFLPAVYVVSLFAAPPFRPVLAAVRSLGEVAPSLCLGTIGFPPVRLPRAGLGGPVERPALCPDQDPHLFSGGSP